MMKRKYLIPSLISIAFAALTTHAVAQEKIKLKVATFLPANHSQVVNGSQIWMDEVKRLTNGRVEFEYYPAEQAGKAAKLMDLMLAGVIDIAEVAPAYVTDKLPLVGVIELPGLANNTCLVSKALRKLSEPGGTIYEADFKSNKVRPLTFFIRPPYMMLTTNRAINKVEDFKGLKMRVSGGAMELAVAKLGAVSVRMSAPEIYESLSRGTLDGVFFSLGSAKSYGLQPVIKYATLGYGFGTPSVLMTISDAKLKSLPKDVQDALIKAGPLADQNNCQFEDASEVVLEKEFGKEGVKVSHFSAGEKKRLNEILASVGSDWAKGLDARGRPGTKALDEFTKAVSAK